MSTANTSFSVCEKPAIVIQSRIILEGIHLILRMSKQLCGWILYIYLFILIASIISQAAIII